MNAEQALHKFWSSFNLVAYDENTVPDDAQLPYITYEASKDFFGATLAQSVSLWYYSQSWAAITEKAPPSGWKKIKSAGDNVALS